MLSAFITFVRGYSAMPLAGQLMHRRYARPGPLVLRSTPLKYLAPTTDRDRTVSRRSEPSSRATLIGEQPNPWDRIQPQDVTSRHRGAKPPRRCGRLGEISLLSPGKLYPLSDGTSTCIPPDHKLQLSLLLDLWVSQLGWLMRLHSVRDFRPR